MVISRIRKVAAFSFIILSLFSVCVLGKIKSTVIFKGRTPEGFYLAQPVIAPRLILQRIEGQANPGKGVSATCDFFIKSSKVVEAGGSHGVVQEIALKCDGSIFVISGLMMEPRD